MTYDESSQLQPSNDPPGDTSGNTRLNELIADYLQKLDGGTAPTRDEFMAAHPDFEFGLREFFADVDHFEMDATLTDPSRPDIDEALPRVRYFGEYELTREIARGGMGVVYEAHQKTLNRTVAVKMILAGMLASDEDVQRFRTEAQAAAGLQHPGIVSIHEVGVFQGQHYFSMDFVDGCNLAELVRESALDASTAARYLKLIAEAVQFAHTRGIVHRDLKPSNILIDPTDETPRITDFGLAKLISDDSSLTATGARLGTPAYMSPEQVLAEPGAVGPASDIYSLGVILYELLTGRPPFRGATALQTLQMVLEQSPVRPRQLNPDIPKDLENVCLKCLQREPADRYESAAELAADLERFLNDEPVRARPLNSLQRSWRRVRRHWRAIIAVLSVAIVGALVTYGLGQREAAQDAERESLLGRISLRTSGIPLTTTIRTDSGELAVPRFTSPTADPVTLTEGDYEFEFETPGRVSQRFRAFVERDRETIHSVALNVPRDLAEFTWSGQLHMVRLDDRDTLMTVSKSGVTRYDAVTGDTVWTAELADDLVLLQAGAEWQEFSRVINRGIVHHIQPLTEGHDLNGDGFDDVVWVGNGLSGAVALSGVDGRSIWVQRSEGDADALPDLRKYIQGPPVPVFHSQDGPPDFLIVRQYRFPDTNDHERSFERISGKTGETFWRYTFDERQFFLPQLKYGKALPAFFETWNGVRTVVLSTGRSLIRLDLETGEELQTVAEFGFPLDALLRSETAGVPAGQAIVHFHENPITGQIQSIDLTKGQVRWSHETHERQSVVFVPDGAGGRVVVVSAEPRLLSEHGARIECLEAASGQTIWDGNRQVQSNPWSDITTRIFLGPDIDRDGLQDVVLTGVQPAQEIAGADNGDPGFGAVMNALSSAKGGALFASALSSANGETLWTEFIELEGDRRRAVLTSMRLWQPAPDGFAELHFYATSNAIARVGPEAGAMCVLNAQTGRLISKLEGVAEPRPADLNGDGQQDLFWPEPVLDEDGSDTGDWTVGTIIGQGSLQWQRFEDCQPAADFNEDGVVDLTARIRHGSIAVCGRTGRVLWKTDAVTLKRVADMNGDGIDDLLANPNDFVRTSELMTCVSGKTGETIWSHKRSPGYDGIRRLISVHAVDSPDDKARRLLVTDFVPDDSRVRLRLFDPSTGDEIWSATTPCNKQDRRKCELTADRSEVIVTCQNENQLRLTVVKVSNGETKLSHTATVDRGQPQFQVADLDRDGLPEVLWRLQSITATSGGIGSVFWTWAPPGDIPLHVRQSVDDVGPMIIARRNDDGQSICFTLDNRVIVVDGQGKTLRDIRIPGRNLHFSQMQSEFRVCDLNGDGNEELIVTAYSPTTVNPDQGVGYDHVIALDITSDDPVLWDQTLPEGPGTLLDLSPGAPETSRVVFSSGNSVYGLSGEGVMQWRCSGPPWWTRDSHAARLYMVNRRPHLLETSNVAQPRLLFRRYRNDKGPVSVEFRVAIPVRKSAQ